MKEEPAHKRGKEKQREPTTSWAPLKNVSWWVPLQPCVGSRRHVQDQGSDIDFLGPFPSAWNSNFTLYRTRVGHDPKIPGSCQNPMPFFCFLLYKDAKPMAYLRPNYNCLFFNISNRNIKWSLWEKNKLLSKKNNNENKNS